MATDREKLNYVREGLKIIEDAQSTEQGNLHNYEDQLTHAYTSGKVTAYQHAIEMIDGFDSMPDPIYINTLIPNKIVYGLVLTILGVIGLGFWGMAVITRDMIFLGLCVAILLATFALKTHNKVVPYGRHDH